MALVHDEGAAAGRGAPVDRAHAIAGHELADVRVLDTFTLHASDLASRERLRLHGLEEPAKRDRPRIRLEPVTCVDACRPRDEPEGVSRVIS
jgi:hypothetical protein